MGPMTKTEIQRHALKLPEHERFELVHALWASLDGPGVYVEPTPLPEWQRQLLDERLAASLDDKGEDWAQVKAELWPETR